MENNLKKFETFINELWTEALTGKFMMSLPSKEAFRDKSLVAIYLTQVYHYAIHTPRHQALVGVNPNNMNYKFMQYCFEHALEETGHELMALNDINSLGFNVTHKTMPPQLPSTQLLIAFLYQEARSIHPIHHLGYGFWSENACPFITEFMQSTIESMGLARNQLTFYTSHITIDEGHASEVRKIIEQIVTKEEDWKGMYRVAEITFRLTLGILKDTFDAYERMQKNPQSEFALFHKNQLA